MNLEVQKLGEAAMDRDPRQATFGFYSGGSFVMDGVRVFSWFESVDELAAFLLNVEPLIYDLDDLDELTAYKVKVTPLLDNLKANGFDEVTRVDMNAAICDFAVIEWWGNFAEILDGETEFSKNLIENFVDSEDGLDSVIPVDQIDDFVEYLKTCGC